MSTIQVNPYINFQGRAREAPELTFMSVEPSWVSHTLLLRFVIQVETFNATDKNA